MPIIATTTWTMSLSEREELSVVGLAIMAT